MAIAVGARRRPAGIMQRVRGLQGEVAGMDLDRLLLEWASASDLATHPLLEAARALLVREEIAGWETEGNLGVFTSKTATASATGTGPAGI